MEEKYVKLSDLEKFVKFIYDFSDKPKKYIPYNIILNSVKKYTKEDIIKENKVWDCGDDITEIELSRWEDCGGLGFNIYLNI